MFECMGAISFPQIDPIVNIFAGNDGFRVAFRNSARVTLSTIDTDRERNLRLYSVHICVT